MWLKENFEPGRFKVTFAKNKEGRVIPEQPVKILFSSADDLFLFKLTMDHYNIRETLEEYTEQLIKSINGDN